MTDSNQVHIIISAFDQEISATVEVDVCSNALDPDLYKPNPGAVLDFSLTVFKDLFQFRMDNIVNDGSDISINGTFGASNSENIVFIVDSDKLNSLSGKLNPMKSTMEVGFTDGKSNFPADKLTIAHDYVRHMALGIFNNIHGVDIFNNEEALLTDLSDLGQKVDVSLRQVIGSSSGLKLSDPITDGPTRNVVRVILEALLKHSPERFSFEADISNNKSNQPIPFRGGDTITYRLTVNPSLLLDESLEGFGVPTPKIYDIKWAIGSSEV